MTTYKDIWYGPGDMETFSGHAPFDDAVDYQKIVEEKTDKIYNELLQGDVGDVTLFCQALKEAHSYPSGEKAVLKIQDAANKDQTELGKALREYLFDWAQAHVEVG